MGYIVGYADYSFYKNVYLGIMLSEDDFPRLSQRASEYIDYITMSKAGRDPALTQIKLCCCALAEQLQTAEKAQLASVSDSGEKQSESVGSYSVAYRSSAEVYAAAQAEMRKTAARYLGSTGLMYRGGCR